MGLLDELEGLLTPVAQPCPVMRRLVEMEPEIRAKLEAALDADPKRVSHKAIYTTLRKAQISLGYDSISEHRAGRCTCGAG